MSALLIGASIDQAFLDLFANLRSETVRYAQRRWGRVIPLYSPWLCFAPLIDHIDPALLYYIPETRGALVSDPDAITAMSGFLSGPGSIALVDLPGPPEDWLPADRAGSRTFDEAVALIKQAQHPIPQLFELVTDYVVALPSGRNRGYSTHLARGAIFRSFPVENDHFDAAYDLVHEVGHQVLQTWQSIDPIISSDPNAPVFSQIRKTNRPAIQSYHAAVALAYMRYLERSSGNPKIAAAGLRRGKTYVETLSKSLSLALNSLEENCQFTALGERMMGEMRELAD